MARTVRVGVIGLGLGVHHLEGVAAAKDAEIAGIADIDAERLAERGDRFGVKNRFADYRKLLAMPEIDAVTVALPNYLHRDVTIAALRAGKHVMCEKPPALNTRQAQDMARAAKKARRILMIAVNNRYRREVQYLRGEVAKGRFGKVYLAKCAYVRRSGIPAWGAGWFVDKAKSGGGPIIDLGVHVIDMTLFILGYPKVTAVSAAAFQNFKHRVPAKYTYSVEDHAIALMRLAGGGVLSFETSWATHLKAGASFVEIYGTKAGAKLEPLEIYSEREGVLFDEIPQVKPTGWEESIHAEVAHFVECVRTGRKPLSPGEQGVDIMKVLDGIYRSAELGREVRLR
jgi:predicted dehydrogenase